jgi:hypothetical protein
MKSRNGFVSNSSSSSFIIRKTTMSEESVHKVRYMFGIPEKQFKGIPALSTDERIMMHFIHDEDEFISNAIKEDHWDIVETPDAFEFFTGMDNSGLADWLHDRYHITIDYDYEDTLRI